MKISSVVALTSLGVLVCAGVISGSDCCSGKSSPYDSACMDGFWINPDNTTCHDVDECKGEYSSNGTLVTNFTHGCEVCNNVCGGYVCSCEADRVLDDDKKTCYDYESKDDTVPIQLGGSNLFVAVPMRLSNGETFESDCIDVNQNYTGPIIVRFDKGVLVADNSSCEVDCRYSEWVNMTECSHNCSNPTSKGGQIYQIREITSGTPEACPEKLKQYVECTKPCPEDCVSEWGDWGQCSVTCGDCGVQKRRRFVLHDAKNGGKECDLKPEFKTCDMQSIPCEKLQSELEPQFESKLEFKSELESEPEPIFKETICADTEEGDKCCTRNINGECDEHKCGTQYKKMVYNGYMQKGSDGIKCKEGIEWLACGRVECPLTAQLYKNRECEGVKFSEFPKASQDELELGFTNETHCLSYPEDGMNGFKCLQMAENVSNSRDDGGRVVFNLKHSELTARCCFFLEAEGQSIHHVKSEGSMCMKYVIMKETPPPKKPSGWRLF